MSEKVFRIGTFNVLNLVLPNHRFYGERMYDEKTFDKKISWIGEQLDKMHCDLVGFQEIFHHEALEKAIGRSDIMRKFNVITAGAKGDLPRVGLATRFDVISHQIIEDFPSALDIEGMEVPLTKFSRPVLKANVRIHSDLEVVVFVVHLKSKRPMLNEGETRKNPVHTAKGQTRSLLRRGMEAMALREILMDVLKDREKPVIVMGDVNDTGMAVTSRIVSGDPPHRKMPKEVKEKIWDVLLYHVKDIQARRSYHDFYYTHIHNGHHEALDHIMVSEEFVPENPDHIAKIGLVSMYNDHLVDETLTNKGVKPWQSDHGQVVARVELVG